MDKEYIERGDAFDAVMGQFCACSDETEEALNGAIENIRKIPTADVAPVVHGKWKPFDLTWGHSIYACTVCEEAIDVPTRMGKPIYAYCPACGAKMEVQDG